MRPHFRKPYRRKNEPAILIVVLLLQLGYCQDVRGQVYIYSDDSTQLYMNRFTNKFNQPYYSVPFSDLRENLPDGKYVYLSIPRADSSKSDRAIYKRITGQYVNNLRFGPFRYYALCGKRGKTLVMTDFYSYKDGLLNGYCMSQTCLGKIYEGQYNMGMRDGFFLSYDGDENLAKIELFRNDTLIYWSAKPDITTPKVAP